MRWLAVALLFGLMTAAGLALTYHHGVPTLVKADDAAAPAHAVPLPHASVISATAGTHPITPHVFGAGAGSYSNSRTPAAGTSPSGSHSNPATTGTDGSSRAAEPTADAIGAPQPQSHPAPSTASPVPQPGAGEYAGQFDPPLDCELPAGCGVPRSVGYVIPQTSGTSGGLPAAHNSNSGQDPPGQGSNPPGNGADPPAVSAPELDPATLAGAITLLLGSLALLRGRRRARAIRRA